MSLSWTPFLNEFFSCLLLALLFSCHSLVRVSSLLLGNALFHPLWVRSFVIHHVVLDQHPSRYSGSQASLPCRRQSSFIDRSSGFLSFSPASSNLAMFAQTVGFSWSCVRSTASLRLRALFHVLRVDWYSPPPRAARVEDVFPELVCSGSSLLSKQLQHCLSPRVFTSPDDRP